MAADLGPESAARADDQICDRLLETKEAAMLLEGNVHNGVIVPDDASAFAEGTRVTITPAAPRRATHQVILRTIWRLDGR